jgi:peptidoglycan/xylan/chitin deacetylase (PgdA/CDA1 family)
MNKRELLARLLDVIPRGATRFLRPIHRGRCLTVLTYHRIFDIDGRFPFDEDLVSASSKDFDYQLSYLAGHFNVINFKMLAGVLAGDGRLPSNALIITFDDGYIDNYEVAYPVLRRHGLTAVMFATAGFIGRRRLFWWDKIAYIVKHAERGVIAIEEPLALEMRLDDYPTRQAAARALIKRAKTMPDERKERLITELAERLGVTLDEEQHQNTMNWDQLRELSRAGIEIGAHSVNHPIFSNVDTERLRTEVSEAKAMIEHELQEPIISFGSPGRGVLDPHEQARFKTTLRGIVAGSGYSFSTMYNWGLNYERDFDPYGIKRIGIENYDSALLFRTKIFHPKLLPY